MKRTTIIFGSAAVLLGGFFVAAFLALAYSPLHTTFNVTVETERLTFVNRGDADSRIPLDEAEVWGFHDRASKPFTGLFELARHTTAVVERIASGPLSVRVTADSSESAGQFFSENGVPVGEAGRFVEFVVYDVGTRADSGRTTVVPLTGEVVPGRDVSFETGGTTAILRSGKVSMLGRSIFSSLFGGDVFEAGSVELDAGDQFFVEQPQSMAYGFVVADERPALVAAYRVVGRRGRIVRPGPSDASRGPHAGYPVSVSLLDRIVHDRGFQALSLLFGTLMILLGIATFVMDYRTYKRGDIDPHPKTDWGPPTEREGAAEGRRADMGDEQADAAPSPHPPPKEMAPVVKSVLLTFCFLLPSVATAQDLVFVRGKDEGRGVLRARMSECFVVLPHHVVEGFMGDVLVVGANGVRAMGTFEEAFEPDLAIVRLPADSDLDCEQWPSLDDYEGMLDNHATGYLETRDEDGASWVRHVNFRYKDGTYVTVKPADPDDDIRQTMSGSALFVNHDGRKTFAGMLMDLDEHDQQSGLVYQADDLMRVLEMFFPTTAPDMDIATAQSVLDRAVASKDGSMQGQVEAIEALIAHGHVFDNSDLSGISLTGAVLERGSFAATSFHASNLSEVKAEGADLAGADLRFATMNGANLAGGETRRTAFPFVEAAAADFSELQAAESQWYAVRAQEARFEDANLQGASFAYSDLRGASFDGADLRGTIFFATDLRGTTFEGATLEETDFTGSILSDDALTRAQAAGACQMDLPREPEGGAYAYVLRVFGVEPIPNPRFDDGYQYSPFNETQHLFRLEPNEFGVCEPRVLRERGWSPLWQHAGEDLIREEIGFRMSHELLQKGRRRAEVRSRIEDHLEWLYPSPQGRFRATLASSDLPPEHQGLIGTWTLELKPDGVLHIDHEGGDAIVARYEPWDRYDIRFSGDFGRLGCTGSFEEYSWHYTSDDELRFSTGYSDGCPSREALLEAQAWDPIGEPD